MSDDKIKVDIDLDAHVTGSESIEQMERQLQSLARQIKSVNAGMVAAARGVSTPGRTKTPAKGTSDQKSVKESAGLDRQAVSSLRQRMTLASRMASQQAQQERQAFSEFKSKVAFKARADAADMRAEREKANEEARSFKQRMSFTSRMGKFAIEEERKLASERARSIADDARAEAKRSRDIARSIRENGRLEASEARRVDRERSSMESARSRNVSRVRQGAGDMRSGAGQVVVGAGATSAVAAATTGAVIRRGVSTRMEVDSEETSLRIFSGQTQAQIVAARKNWLDNLSITNGASIAEGIKTYGEVLKAGIKGAEQVTDSIMKGAVGLELNVKETTKLTGLIDRNYGSASSPEKLKSALNAVAVAAREDPTQSSEIVEGVKRGFGVMSTGNWTPEQLTAAVSGGQSVGITPGKAGTFIGTAGKRLSAGASQFLGPKQRSELDFAAKEFGFADAKALASAYTKNSYNVFMDSMRKLKSMSPEKAAQVSQALYGTQWSDEGLQYSQGSEGVDKTYSEITDNKNANFLDEAAHQRAASLQGQWNSTKAIFGRFWDAFGAGFEDILNSVNSYFMDLNSTFDYGKVKSYVTDFMDGLKGSFGVSTWKELLKNAFGGNIGNIGTDIKAFAKGLGDGIQSIGRLIRSVATVFGGGNMSAETMGNLTGKFVALSIALIALAPVVSILGGLVSIIGGLAIAGRGLAGLAGLGAGAAGAGAAGAMRGAGLLLSRVFSLALVAEIGANRGAIATWMLNAGKSLLTAAIEGIKSAFTPEAIKSAMKSIVSEVIPAPLQRLMDGNGLEEKKGLGGKVLDGIGKPSIPVAPAERGVLGKAWDWITSSLVGSAHASEMEGRPPANASPTVKLTEALNDNTAAIRTTFDSPISGLGGLIQRASITNTGTANAVRSSITDSAGQLRYGGGSPLSGSTASGGTFGTGPLQNSVPGSALNRGGGLSRRGIIGGGGDTSPTPGNGFTPPNMKGQGADNAKIAYDFFRSKGLSHEATAGILASIKQESGFNPQARGDGGRAHGLFQHHPDRRAAILRGTGIDMSKASVEDQLKGAFYEMESGSDAGAKRALRILRTPGITARQAGGAFVQNFERPARDERASRGAMAEGFAKQFAPGGSGRTASLGAGIPGLGGAGQYDGLRVKGSQAYAGGASYAGVTDLARQVQESLPGGVKHFSAFNDAYHKGTGSKHASGLAFDTTLIDAARSSEAAEEIRNKMRAAGLKDDMFKVIDEYRNPSARSTGGHIHSQFNTPEAAKQYSDYIESLKRSPASELAKTEELKASGWKPGMGGNLTKRADEFNSSGWKPGLGKNGEGLGRGALVPLGESTPPKAINTISANALNGGGGAGHSSSTTNSITINGAGQDSESIANAVQRKLNEKMNRRTHDLSPSSLSV